MRHQLLLEANEQAQNEAKRDSNKFGYRTPYAYYDHVMGLYASWLLTLDDLDDVWVINLREAMLPRLKECYGDDPIHPNAEGHSVMAKSFLAHWPRIQKETKMEKQ